MGLEPLIALGLAANVIQLVDFASGLISKTCGVYRGKTETRLRGQDLLLASQRLANLTRSLDESLATYASSKKLTVAELGLVEVSEECKKIAAEFQSELEAFSVAVENKLWHSIRLVFKDSWKNAGLDKMERRLARQREDILAQIAVVIFRQVKKNQADREQVQLSSKLIAPAARTRLASTCFRNRRPMLSR